MRRLFRTRRMAHPFRIVCSSLLLLGWQGAGHANPILIGSQDVPLGTEAVIDLRNVNSGDETGVRVKNLTQDGDNKSVSVNLIPGPSDLGFQLPGGFVLLDNTLLVTSDLTIPGGRRIRARLDFGRYNGGRAGIRAMGVRFNSIRLLRADFARQRWIPAVDSIRKRAEADIRFLTGIRANFVLGNHGIDTQNEFVWAVVDTAGDQYFAIGGTSAIPLPAAWLLFLTGSGMLALVARRRRSDAS